MMSGQAGDIRGKNALGVGSSEGKGALGFIHLYYGLTPVFLICELLWGINVRVPFVLSSPMLRYIYYGMCTVFALLWWWKRHWTPFVALLESSANIILLVTGFMHVLYGASWLETDEIPAALTVKGVIGFSIAAMLWLITFKRAEALVMARLGRR
jgi:hypothetical protein